MAAPFARKRTDPPMTKRMIFPLIIGGVGALILISLGLWQVQRLQWKAAILADIDARILAAPVAIPATPDPEADRFLPVRAAGRIAGPELHVLVSQKGQGAGFRIISAFETEGRRLLLDRGFVVAEAKEAPRPAVETEVIGNLHWPDEIDRWTPDNDRVENYWFSRDVPTMAAALGTEPVLIIARATSETNPVVTPFPVDSAGIPNDHLEYAITWFSLAAIWVGMTGFLLARIRAGRI